MKFGAAIWPFQWHPPYEDAIDRIASLGFAAVELIAWDGDHLGYYDDATIDRLRRRAEAGSLEVSQFVFSPRGIASLDEEVRRRCVDDVGRAVRIAAKLGSPIINSTGATPFGRSVIRMPERVSSQTFDSGYEAGLDWDATWEAYVTSMRECVALAEEAGLRYSIEPVPFRLVATTSDLLRLVDRVGSPALGMNFDPSHLFPMGEFPDVTVARMGERVLHCDFSDNDGTTNLHWRPGKGKIAWTRLFEALVAIGYDGVISVEMEDLPGVSRAAGALAASAEVRPVATEDFARETLRGVQHLRRAAAAAGVEIEWRGAEGEAG